MELFAYYNQKLISSLVKCTKNSLEQLKSRALPIAIKMNKDEAEEKSGDIKDGAEDENYEKDSGLEKILKKFDNKKEEKFDVPALFTTSLELKIPDFYVEPSVGDIEVKYKEIIANIFETHHAVVTWGKLSKTPERKATKPMLDEIRYPKNLEEIITYNKERRLKHDFKRFMEEMQKRFQCLWAEDRDEQSKSKNSLRPILSQLTFEIV